MSIKSRDERRRGNGLEDGGGKTEEITSEDLLPGGLFTLREGGRA